MARIPYSKNERIVFVLGCNAQTFNGSSKYHITAQKGEKGVIMEDNGSRVRVLLESGHHLNIPADKIDSYIIPDMALLNALEERKLPSVEKERVSRGMKQVGLSLDKLAKLVIREWNPVRKRKLEKDLDHKIKTLLSLKQLVKGSEWDK